MTRAELDLASARERLARAAAEARRLEDAGSGFESQEAWRRYELIEKAIEAQERSERAARRAVATR